MHFDLFASISQHPRIEEKLGDHGQLLAEFLQQAKLADSLGMECVWTAESHFSSEVQKQSTNPVIPHWEGEVGVNTDFFQLATQVLLSTDRINVGSAILNILASGGPLVNAERIASLIAWNSPKMALANRQVNIGFSSGRFDYVNRLSGVQPRNDFELENWRNIKQAWFLEAGEIFVRLLNGETLSSDDINNVELDLGSGENTAIDKRWEFEATKLVPEFDRSRLNLTVGSHDHKTQVHFNSYAPVRVFNLSITAEAEIEKTHELMSSAYNATGGKWRRDYMPRTVMVFINNDRKLPSDQARAQAAKDQATRAISAFWKAMQGTIDNEKIAKEQSNALIGTPEDIANQIMTRYQPNERLMLWFDFFRDSNDEILESMSVFMEEVVPILREKSFIP